MLPSWPFPTETGKNQSKPNRVWGANVGRGSAKLCWTRLNTDDGLTAWCYNMKLSNWLVNNDVMSWYLWLYRKRTIWILIEKYNKMWFIVLFLLAYMTSSNFISNMSRTRQSWTQTEGQNMGPSVQSGIDLKYRRVSPIGMMQNLQSSYFSITENPDSNR